MLRTDARILAEQTQIFADTYDDVSALIRVRSALIRAPMRSIGVVGEHPALAMKHGRELRVERAGVRMLAQVTAMRVKAPHAESPRFPWRWQSAKG